MIRHHFMAIKKKTITTTEVLPKAEHLNIVVPLLIFMFSVILSVSSVETVGIFPFVLVSSYNI